MASTAASLLNNEVIWAWMVTLAVLTALPEQAIIDGFKGVVDFYVHRGIICARKWPKSPGHERSPAVQAQWSNFVNSTRIWKTLSPEIQDAYRQLASGTTLSGYEWFMRGYITGIYQKPPPP